MWFSRLLASAPGTPEMHNLCLLLATVAEIIFTGIVVLSTQAFDPVAYASGIGILIGGTGIASAFVAKGRQIEGDAPTPNENSLPPPKA